MIKSQEVRSASSFYRWRDRVWEKFKWLPEWGSANQDENNSCRLGLSLFKRMKYIKLRRETMRKIELATTYLNVLPFVPNGDVENLRIWMYMFNICFLGFVCLFLFCFIFLSTMSTIQAWYRVRFLKHSLFHQNSTFELGRQKSHRNPTQDTRQHKLEVEWESVRIQEHQARVSSLRMIRLHGEGRVWDRPPKYFGLAGEGARSTTVHVRCIAWYETDGKTCIL